MSQNSMKQTSGNEWKILDRTAAGIEERIGELAASYAPEWHFDREDPDIGSVIAKLFAGQMEENIGHCNQVLDRYHREFVNFLGLSLLPAKPARATVLLGLVQDTIPGAEVPKGTRFLADTEDGEEQIVFETTHSLYVTSASLDYAFLTLREDGSILPVKGRFEEPKIMEEEETPPSGSDEGQFRPFRLFGHSPNLTPIQKNALLFWHPVALNVENNPIRLKITGNVPLLEKIRDGAYRFLYCTEEGLLPVEEVKVQPELETVVLKKEKKNAELQIEGNPLSLLVIEASDPVTGTRE